jgi:hypothetical protein
MPEDNRDSEPLIMLIILLALLIYLVATGRVVLR